MDVPSEQNSHCNQKRQLPWSWQNLERRGGRPCETAPPLHARTRTHMCTHIHTCTCMHTHKHAHMCTHTRTQACMQVHMIRGRYMASRIAHWQECCGCLGEGLVCAVILPCLVKDRLTSCSRPTKRSKQASRVLWWAHHVTLGRALAHCAFWKCPPWSCV